MLACEAWQEAADEYERRGNRVEAAVAHARLAEALVDWGDLARGRFHIDAALGLLQDVGPSERMVELLGLAVQAAYLRGDVEEMTRMINSMRTFETYHKVLESYSALGQQQDELGTIA